MPYDPEKHHRRSIRLPYYDYSLPGYYFITLCAYQRQCLFGTICDARSTGIATHEMRLNVLGEAVRSHWVKLPNHYPCLQLDEFVVMPNHMHGILVITDKSNDSINPLNDSINPLSTDKRHGIPDILRSFKTFSARRINQIRKVKGTPVWQRNYYEHVIRSEATLLRLRRYIQNNPLHWHEDQLHPNCPSQW